MDPNLYFRFAMPAWIGAMAISLMLWDIGDPLLGTALSFVRDQQVATVLLAVLGTPAAGFLLNTIVVAWADLGQRGPVHSAGMRDFRKQVTCALEGQRCYEARRFQQLAQRVEVASLMAYFEYRQDTQLMIDWRRRQRAAYFTNWACVVAILFSLVACWVLVALPVFRPHSGFAPPIVGTVACGLLVFLFIYNACQSQKLADEQQKLWMLTLSDSDIRRFVRDYGKGEGFSKAASSHL